MTSEELFEKWYASYWAGEPYTGSKQDFFDCFKAGMKAVLENLPDKKDMLTLDSFVIAPAKLKLSDMYNSGFNLCIDEIREKFKEIEK